MSKTDYAGIDYSLGKSNINLVTGIHYGVISIHEVLQSWSDSSDGYYHYTCPYCGSDLKKGMDTKRCNACYKRIDPDRDFDDLEPSSYYYNQDGYECEQSQDDTDIFILKSPYFTYCQYASPCAPGAGYLANYMDKGEGVRAYCFGHDWFEEVETGEWKNCEYCEGTGYRQKTSIPNYENRKESFKNYDDNRVFCWVCEHNFSTGQIGKVKETIQQAPYPVYSVKTGKEVKP